MIVLFVIVPPRLVEVTDPIVQIENSKFLFNIQESEGHPAVPVYQWFFNGFLIDADTSINPDVSVYPLIVFNPVLRTQSGNYSMTASTDGGDATGYFILDILGGLVTLFVYKFCAYVFGAHSQQLLQMVLVDPMKCLL